MPFHRLLVDPGSGSIFPPRLFLWLVRLWLFVISPLGPLAVPFPLRFLLFLLVFLVGRVPSLVTVSFIGNLPNLVTTKNSIGLRR